MSLRSALFEESYHLGPILNENEGLFGLGPCKEEFQAKTWPTRIRCSVWGRYDLARGVADHAPLVQHPLLGEAFVGVEALEISEGFCKGSAGAGGLLPHAPEDGFARFLSLPQLFIRFLE